MPLRAPHVVQFAYERSVGGATAQFLRGLANAEITGSRMPDGRVVVPPVDHDPTTGAPNEEFVRVGDAGVVRTWTWVPDPRPEHPLDRPFAFALVELDGADTSLLHVVEVGGEAEMTTGMRVRADWRAARTGSIRDIRGFVPEATASVPPSPAPALADITVASDVRLEYTFEPGHVLSEFYRSLAVGRIEGGRCRSCAKVYVPPRARCPVCGTGATEVVLLGDTGLVESFTVVHVPVHGMELDLPFTWAWIRLDGADVPFAHLLGEVAAGAVWVGQRVAAVWSPPNERLASWEAIRYFRPVRA